MTNVGKKLKIDNCFTVSSNGKSEGLTMLWNFETKVNITSFNSHHINAKLEIKDGKQIRCTTYMDFIKKIGRFVFIFVARLW